MIEKMSILVKMEELDQALNVALLNFPKTERFLHEKDRKITAFRQ